MYEAQKRFAEHSHQQGTLIYLGDHDPSGICMNEDIEGRLNKVFGVDMEVRRIALTIDQIDQYTPPPNPAKQTDSRFQGYADKYGEESWELDAIDPRTLDDLITDEINQLTDVKKLKKKEKEQKECREQLVAIAEKLVVDPKWRP